MIWHQLPGETLDQYDARLKSQTTTLKTIEASYTSDTNKAAQPDSVARGNQTQTSRPIFKHPSTINKASASTALPTSKVQASGIFQSAGNTPATFSSGVTGTFSSKPARVSPSRGLRNRNSVPMSAITGKPYEGPACMAPARRAEMAKFQTFQPSGSNFATDW